MNCAFSFGELKGANLQISGLELTDWISRCDVTRNLARTIRGQNRTLPDKLLVSGCGAKADLEAKK